MQWKEAQTVRRPSARAETDSYEVYNLLYWLKRSDPSCHHANSRFDAFQEKVDFEPREYPDRDFWTGSWVGGGESPVSAEELLQKEPDKAAALLLKYEGTGYRGPSREGLMSELTRAVTMSHKWAQRLAEFLAEVDPWREDVWRSILLGWEGSVLKPRQWSKVLTLIDKHPQVMAFPYGPAHLLYTLVSRPEKGFGVSSLPLAERIARRLWETCTASAEDIPESSDDWMASAINHPAGNTTLFWMNALLMRRNRKGADWRSIPREYQCIFGEAVHGDSLAAGMARTLLASHTTVLYALDREWTRQNIIPLYDWRNSTLRAQQAWQGFLYWGRLNDTLVVELMPHYLRSFSRVSAYLGESRDRFSEHLAHIAVYHSANPVKEGYLGPFLSQVESHDRAEWASSMAGILRELDEAGTSGLWDRWLREYWKARLKGTLWGLDAEEWVPMLRWLTSLGPAFPDAVRAMDGCVLPVIHDIPLYYLVHNSDYHERYPDELALLLKHLLDSTTPPFNECEAVGELVSRLIATGAPRDTLRAVCDRLADLGCANASGLAKRLNE